MRQLLALIGFGMVNVGDPSVRVDVTIQNDSSYAIRLFLPESGLNVGPVRKGQSLLVEQAFVPGPNKLLISREMGPDGSRSARKHAVALYQEHFVRSAGGRTPSHVNVDVDDQSFNTITSGRREVDLTLQNLTNYPVYVVGVGAAGSLGLAPPGKSPKLLNAIPYGRSRVILVAMRDDRDPLFKTQPYVGVTSREVNGGSEASSRSGKPVQIVVTPSLFGPRGLPPLGAALPKTLAKPTLNGKWQLPDGLVLRIEGSNGYWVEVGFLAEFGFKPGFHSHRDIKEVPNRPGNYTCEVLYRFRGGAIDGWKPLSFTLKDADTISAVGVEWKRLVGGESDSSVWGYSWLGDTLRGSVAE